MIKRKLEFSAIIKKGEKFFIAKCIDVDVVSQGKTVEEARKNLVDAVNLYLEENPEEKALLRDISQPAPMFINQLLANA